MDSNHRSSTPPGHWGVRYLFVYHGSGGSVWLRRPYTRVRFQDSASEFIRINASLIVNQHLQETHKFHKQTLTSPSPKARTSAGIYKWVWHFLVILAGGGAGLCQPGTLCLPVQDIQVSRVEPGESIHTVGQFYHLSVRFSYLLLLLPPGSFSSSFLLFPSPNSLSLISLVINFLYYFIFLSRVLVQESLKCGLQLSLSVH